MPDHHGFTHEVDRGAVYNRCVECEWPGWGVIVSERERERHHRAHVRERELALTKQQKANLALARKVKRQINREKA